MLTGSAGRITAAVLPVLLLGDVGAAWRAPLTGQQPRATALVDFRALDAAGEPVVDLKATDLILRVAGRDRPVSSLEWVSRRNTETQSVLAPPFATNTAVQPARGDIVVLIDEASIAPGREQGMRDAVAHFLSRTSPTDRVRLISLRAVGPALPFEEGLRDLPAALARFSGHSTASETANDLVCRSQAALDMMQSLFGNYSGGPIPTFVIVSGGFGSPPSGGVTSFGNYGKCPPLRGLDFEELGAAARAINAATYVVHLTDATASRLPRTDLERGGFAIDGMPPGELVMRAVVSIDGKVVGRVKRTLRKVK